MPMQQEKIINNLRKLNLELNKIINKETQFQVQRLCLENFEAKNLENSLLTS